MDRARIQSLLCLVLLLTAAASSLAQPKLIITTVGSDISNDGNTVVGTILDENVYYKLTTFTRGTGFQFWGPVLRSADGGIQMSDISGGSFFLTTGLYNGFNGSTYWPQSSPGLFGNYTGPRPCCNGTTCTVVDPSACLSPSYAQVNGSTCSPNPCPSTPPASGGCCNAVTGVCTYTLQAACVSPNYYFAGDQACGNYPCSHGHTLPFEFSSATNSWTNCGSIPNNTGSPGLGAAHCDAGIATPYGISSGGRYIVGGSWYGGFGTVACGTRAFIYDASDTSVQMLPLIATSAGCQNFNQAWAVSTDGLVVLGRDTHATTDPSGAPISCNGTCLAVWDRDIATGQFLLPRTPRACCNGGVCTVVDPATCPSGSVALASTSCSANPCPPNPNPPVSGACCNAQSMNCTATSQAACTGSNFWIGAASCSPHNPCLPSTETVLDEYGAGSLKGSVMNRAGTIIAASVSSGKADYVLADSSKFGDLVKYVKNTGTGAWDMVQVGKVPGSSAGGQGNQNMVAYGISDDGNTIVGAYNGGSGSFIWRPSINAGVPMDFALYVQSLNGGQPFPPTGGMSLGQSISADGSAMMVSWAPPAPAACGPNAGLADLSRAGVLYLDGSSIPCQPPVIAGGPYDVIQREYTRFGMVGNVFVAGSYPLTVQWQRESPPLSNTWVDLQDSCGQFTSDDTWTYEGTHGFQLRVNMLADPSVRDGRYRVVATNECGSATSAVANFSAIAGACCYYDTNSGTTACFVTLPTRCTQTVPFGLSGVYVGDNSTCSPTACDAVIGACCYSAGGVQCVLDVTTHCTNSASSGGRAGSFAGGGTTCTPVICATVSGACCYSIDGISPVVCTFELSSHCTQSVSVGGIAGVYAGDATACAAGGSCPAGTVGIGACCFNATLTSDIICAVQASTHCTASYTNGGLQGKYQGDGLACGASTCKPATFGVGSSLGACCFTDPANPASGSLCIITYLPNCSNYPNGSNDANTAPFSVGLGGNFYTNTCCMPSSTPPISGCNSTANCAATEGACINTPFDNSSGVVCTVQVRATRCTRRYNAGGLFGTWVPSTTCSPSVLAANSGACCYQPTDGTGAPTGCPVCTIQPHDRCVTVNNGGLSGVYGGNGTTCTPVAQCPAQYGACCTGNTCAVVARSSCTGTSYAYPAQSCGAVACGSISVQPPPSAACCNTTTLACTLTTQAACPAPNSWIYTGTCTPSNACIQPGFGACCLVFNTCLFLCPIDCAANSGTYSGDGTTCTANPCGGAPGVCCRGSTCTTDITSAAACTSSLPGGQFAGAFYATTSTTCNTGPVSNAPCCYADYNKVNGISVQDIFDFLGDWFAGVPFANVGGTGTGGTLSVQNIFDFLNDWFAGGC
jgi:hypothetical protein